MSSVSKIQGDETWLYSISPEIPTTCCVFRSAWSALPLTSFQAPPYLGTLALLLPSSLETLSLFFVLNLMKSFQNTKNNVTCTWNVFLQNPLKVNFLFLWASIILCSFYNCLWTCPILLLNSELLRKGEVHCSHTLVPLSPIKLHDRTQHRADHWHRSLTLTLFPMYLCSLYLVFMTIVSSFMV